MHYFKQCILYCNAIKIPLSVRLAGRPKIRWENNMKEDLRITKICNWTKCIQGRVKWKVVLE